MIPSLNGIEISVKGATSVLLGVKGLNELFPFKTFHNEKKKKNWEHDFRSYRFESDGVLVITFRSKNKLDLLI